MYKLISKVISSNIYVLTGILIGLYISSLISDTLEPVCHSQINTIHRNVTVKLPKIGLRKATIPPSTSTLRKTKLVRPRYYSTELGIKEKLFVGIFTSEEKVNTLALHINKTIGHLVDKIKFFITAQYKLKSKFNLTGLVGFTDTRYKYRPFQIVKYIGDNFAQDFDYYFLANDYTFTNARKLKDIVGKISVGMDVYLGTPVQDSSFCNLDSGIVISNSVLRAMREHLDWCVINAISDDHSENVGRCIHHSIGLACQQTIQGRSLPTYKIKHFEISGHLLELSEKQEFNEAITIYPILQSNVIHLLNSYFLRQRLTVIKRKIDKLSNDLINGVWPAGARIGAKPATRFDLPKQFYFNMSHMFFPDDFTVIRQHSKADLDDILNVIYEIQMKLLRNEKYLQFNRLINGYRVFDLSRGMDYTIDLEFKDLNNGKNVIKRFQVCKPLGKVEFIPVPYVTENSRITIIFTIEEHQITESMNFLTNFSTLFQQKEKCFILIVLLYKYESPNKGKEDIYYEIKNYVLKINSKYKNEDVKMSWLSIRLPQKNAINLITNEVLNFGIVDLALKKIGLESLILILDCYCNITKDFLNRVRMNTIVNFQIFNPIPFRQYNPKVTQFPYLEINKNSGHFDKEEYKYIAFYGKDYVIARKKFQQFLPIVRTDLDIEKIAKKQFRNCGNIFGMFVKFGDNLHCMRATEMSLKLKYYEEISEEKSNLFLGSGTHLAKLLMMKSEKIKEL